MRYVSYADYLYYHIISYFTLVQCALQAKISNSISSARRPLLHNYKKCKAVGGGGSDERKNESR